MTDYLHRFDSWTITYTETMLEEPTVEKTVYHTVTAYTAEIAFEELAKLVEKGDDVHIKCIEIYHKEPNVTIVYGDD